jgi:hypothetical protein
MPIFKFTYGRGKSHIISIEGETPIFGIPIGDLVVPNVGFPFG